MSGKSIASAVGLAALLVTAVTLAVASGSGANPSADDIPAIATARSVDALIFPVPPAAELPNEEKDWAEISAFSRKYFEDDEHEVVRPEVRDEDDEDKSAEVKKREEEKRREEEKKRQEAAPKQDGGSVDGESSSGEPSATSEAPDED